MDRISGASVLHESKVDLHGVQLNHMQGPANGPPLLLFHGVLRRWQTFHPLWSHLTPRWQVHGLDFPGHGASDRADDYQVCDYVRVSGDFVRRQFSAPL